MVSDEAAASIAPRDFAEGEGAELGPDGGYLHTWNEDRGPAGRARFARLRAVPFTAAEDASIRSAFEDYCEREGVPTEERVALVQNAIEDRALRGVWVACAAKFRHRSLRAVHRRALRLLDPRSRAGAWTETDLASLREAVAELGRAWLAVGARLRRAPLDCRTAYDRDTSMAGAPGPVVAGAGLTDGNNVQSVAPAGRGKAWGARENDALAAAVHELGTTSEKGIVFDIPWRAVASRVQSRTASQCLERWRTMRKSAAAEAELCADVSATGTGAGAWTAIRDAALLRALSDAIEANGSDAVRWSDLLPGCAAASSRARFATLLKQLPPLSSDNGLEAQVAALIASGLVGAAATGAAGCGDGNSVQDDDDDAGGLGASARVATSSAEAERLLRRARRKERKRRRLLRAEAEAPDAADAALADAATAGAGAADAANAASSAAAAASDTEAFTASAAPHASDGDAGVAADEARRMRKAKKLARRQRRESRNVEALASQVESS